MLVPNWIFNIILFIIGVRLIIWVFVFYKWLANWYQNDTGIVRFLKKIGRWVAGIFALFAAVSIVSSFINPLLFRDNGTVILVEGDVLLEQRHFQQFFTPDYAFATGETLTLTRPGGDSLLLVNDSDRSFILWEAIMSGDSGIDQSRIGIIPPFGAVPIPDRISCMADGKTLPSCIPKRALEHKPTYYLSY